jgi:hypothetical protein
MSAGLSLLEHPDKDIKARRVAAYVLLALNELDYRLVVQQSLQRLARGVAKLSQQASSFEGIEGMPSTWTGIASTDSSCLADATAALGELREDGTPKKLEWHQVIAAIQRQRMELEQYRAIGRRR